MNRRKRKPSFARAMAGPLLGLVALGLLWLAIQFDVHTMIGRELIEPLAPKPR